MHKFDINTEFFRESECERKGRAEERDETGKQREGEAER